MNRFDLSLPKERTLNTNLNLNPKPSTRCTTKERFVCCVLSGVPWLIIWLAMLVTGFVLVPKPAHDVCTLVYTTVSGVRN